jgi:hypothetical protein
LSLGVEPNMERIRVIKKNYLVGLSIWNNMYNH